MRNWCRSWRSTSEHTPPRHSKSARNPPLRMPVMARPVVRRGELQDLARRALCFSWANTFIAPRAMKANARRPRTIHRITFMHASSPNPNISFEQPGGSLQEIVHFFRRLSCFAIGVLLLSKYAPLNEARLDRRDPPLGLTQRRGAGMDGVGAQDKVVIMRHSRANDELCVGLGLEFDH